jgi:hypothetical protein
MSGAEMGYMRRFRAVRARLQQTAHMTQSQDTPILKTEPAVAPQSRVTAGTISLAIAVVLTVLVAVYEAAVLGGIATGAFWSWWWDFGSVITTVLAIATLVFGLVGLRRASRGRLSAVAGTAVALYFLVTRVVGSLFGVVLYNLM